MTGRTAWARLRTWTGGGGRRWPGVVLGGPPQRSSAAHARRPSQLASLPSHSSQTNQFVLGAAPLPSKSLASTGVPCQYPRGDERHFRERLRSATLEQSPLIQASSKQDKYAQHRDSTSMSGVQDWFIPPARSNVPHSPPLSGQTRRSSGAAEQGKGSVGGAPRSPPPQE